MKKNVGVVVNIQQMANVSSTDDDRISYNDYKSLYPHGNINADCHDVIINNQAVVTGVEQKYHRGSLQINGKTVQTCKPYYGFQRASGASELIDVNPLSIIYPSELSCMEGLPHTNSTLKACKLPSNA